ncbi:MULTISPECIES: fructosamine kinase family protein [Aphanothece]|uniref:fructosamine kinase family protein n=1 Tax=Aphanothece TaxID=1121 RepID=UPI003985630D
MTGLPLQPLAAWLEPRLGRQLRDLRPVGGGCIHQAWQLVCADGSRLFAKTNRAEALALLEAEAHGLEALARWAPADLLVPRPLALGVAGERAVLVLPWLELTGRNGDWSQLGRGLARLHRASGADHGGRGFGLETDNFIGSAPQRNGWRSGWASFFAECRLRPQLEWAAAAGLALHGAAELLEHLPDWVEAHGCEPVLVHGDLWCGNAGLVAGGGGAIFDPACYWGDREVDLAMAGLFGGFPQAFFEGYSREWPLPPGAERRCEIYNLYHLLNHANLFGGGYLRQAQAVVDRLVGRA